MVEPMKIGRRWFIQSKKEKIEDVYTFKSDKDVTNLFPITLKVFARSFRCLEAAPMALCSEASIKFQRICARSKQSQRIKSPTLRVSKMKLKSCANSYLGALVSTLTLFPRIILILSNCTKHMKTRDTFIWSWSTVSPQLHLICPRLCKGGELFDRITQKGHFTEDEARTAFKQVIYAINYCHTFNIAHR